MSEIPLWITFGNQLFSLIVTILTSMYAFFATYTWLTQNGNILFSGVVAISTVVYAFLTWQLVSETRIMRKAQTEPSLHVFIQPRDAHNEITDMFIQNTGMGVARNIKFKVLSDFMYYRSDTLSKDYWLEDIHLLKNGLEALAPNQKIRVFSTSYEDVRELNSKTYFEIGIEYANYKDDKTYLKYLLDLSTLPANGMSMHDYFKDSVKKIEENLTKISSNIENFANSSRENIKNMHTDYNRLLFDLKNNEEKTIIAKSLVKKTLLKFYYNWKTCNLSENSTIYTYTLQVESSNFIDIAASVTGILPEKLIDDLISYATEMNDMSNRTWMIRDYMEKYKEVAMNVYKMYNEFDKYFDD